jgi:tripartite-type tricarboxylate transporter receptor subunit TctC
MLTQRLMAAQCAIAPSRCRTRLAACAETCFPSATKTSGGFVMKFARLAAAALAFAAPAASSLAQNYPNAPIRIISGFPAGTTADISARVVGAKIGQILNGQVVVENRPGAASSIAAASVARADKDGYTLYIGSAANIINAAQNPNLTFDFIKDFTPITLMTSTPTVLAVTPELGVKNVKELIAAAKAKPDSISFGSSGVASSTHLALELFKSLADVKIQHVPYTGSPQVVTDMLANRIQGYFAPASTVMGHVRAGKLVALGTTDPARTDILPDLPTMIEAGVPGCVSVLWFGLVAPTGTPQAVLDRLSKAANEALKDPEVAKSLQGASIARHGGSPADFSRHIAEENKRWTDVITKAGLKK